MTHWALALVKGIREPHEVKKKSFDLGENRTHDLRIRSTVTLPTELGGLCHSGKYFNILLERQLRIRIGKHRSEDKRHGNTNNEKGYESNSKLNLIFYYTNMSYIIFKYDTAVLAHKIKHTRHLNEGRGISSSNHKREVKIQTEAQKYMYKTYVHIICGNGRHRR